MTDSYWGKARSKARSTLVALAIATVASAALGAVRREGTWPDHDKPITLELSGVSRVEALRKLADAAGWGLASQVPQGGAPIELHVVDKPADQVLGLLLADGDYIASRDGDLVSIRPAVPSGGPSAGVVSDAPPAPHVAKHRGEDRVVTGRTLTIGKGEVVHDATVFGGSLDVYGTITGDLAVLGGVATVHEGGHVEGDATAIGGSLKIEHGAHVDGKAGVVGGVLEGADEAGGAHRANGHDSSDDDHADADDHSDRTATTPHSVAARTAKGASSAVGNAAAFFLLGSVLLALAARRMESLRVEAAARPMRSVALGLVGVVAAFALVIALCVTIVGIPVAIVAVLALVVAIFAGICAVLTTIGQALLGHRTSNPYAHLALGCFAFVLVGSIPWLGSYVQLAVLLAGFGTIVATRAAGLVKPRASTGQGPYREPGVPLCATEARARTARSARAFGLLNEERRASLTFEPRDLSSPAGVIDTPPAEVHHEGR